MKPTRALIPALSFALLLAPDAALAADYHVSIPGGFASSGDGAWSRNSETIHISTKAGSNVVAVVQADMSKARSSGMTLGNQGQLSGISGAFAMFSAAKSGKGFYEKGVSTCHGVVVLRVDYATGSADSFPSYLDALASSFRSAC